MQYYSTHDNLRSCLNGYDEVNTGLTKFTQPDLFTLNAPNVSNLRRTLIEILYNKESKEYRIVRMDNRKFRVASTKDEIRNAVVAMLAEVSSNIGNGNDERKKAK